MSSPGPSFRAIANRAEVTPAFLRHFMLTAHSATTPPFTMPNAKLSDRQLDAVIAYILSLRGQPWQRRPAALPLAFSPARGI